MIFWHSTSISHLSAAPSLGKTVQMITIMRGKKVVAGESICVDDIGSTNSLSLSIALFRCHKLANGYLSSEPKEACCIFPFYLLDPLTKMEHALNGANKFWA